MPYGFLDTYQRRPSAPPRRRMAAWECGRQFSGDRASDQFTESETAFIGERDSFYMATVTENGWPYVPASGGSARLPEGPQR